MQNNIGHILTKRAQLNGPQEVYADSQRGIRLTFTELNERVNQVAAVLAGQGLEVGDRVAIMMMNSAEFIESYFAIAKLGGIVVPLNWRLVADELEYILKDSGAKILIFGDEFVDLATELQSRGDRTDLSIWLHSVASDANPVPTKNRAFQCYEALRNSAPPDEPKIGAADDELLYIMYTSGTMGLPKGVVHTHNTMLWALLTVAMTADIRHGDRYLAALPMFHVGALMPVTLNIYMGVTSIVMREFDPTQAWELIDKEWITTALLVPAMLNFMIQVPNLGSVDYSRLRWIQSGAAPLPVSLIEQYAKLGIDVHQIYGLTEVCGPACLITREDSVRKIGSTGRAFFHTEVRVVNADGVDCEPDVQGEVWVKGRHVMKEYWHQPEATRDTITVDGWVKTGDLAILDQDGFVYIQDRIKDMIISGGENVYPAEIENVILTHPQVTEVAVIGQPSETWGESPFAVVVRKEDDLGEADILKFCEGKLARFKLPKGVAFVDVIPRNANGKVLKRLLREDYPGPAPA